jgi:ABC-2 type transport system permease protein
VRPISIIFKRELGAYLKSPSGYVVAALALFVDGLLFYIEALGPRSGARLSGEVLSKFFWVASGLTMVAAVLLSMRLVAQERSSGSMVLLNTSPVRDWEVIAGKFLSAFVFLAGITVLTTYMPLLVMVNGKISLGHVLSGYSGLLLLGGAVLAIGLFASSLVSEQVIAGLIAAAITAALILCYQLAQNMDAPLRGVFEGVGLYHKHFFPFMNGIFHVKNVIYYLAVIYFFLLLATKTLEAKRWQ